jgi:ATP-dependent RNA helicase DDX27
VTYDGLESSEEEGSQSPDSGESGDEADARAHKPAARSAWSFKDAIAHIDATQQRSSVTTSLRDKIAAVQRQKGRVPGAKNERDGKKKAAPAAVKKASHEEDDGGSTDESGYTVDEDEEEDEKVEDGGDDDEEDDDEEDEEEEDDEEEDDDDEGDDDEDDEDDGEAMQDDDEDGAAAPAASSSSSSTLQRASVSEADGMIASSRPNPHRSRGGAGDSSLPPELAAEYSAFFAPDPFAAAGGKGGKGSGKGGASASSSSAAGADNVRDVAVKGGAAVKAAAAAAAAAAPAAAASSSSSSSSPKEPTTFPEMNLARPLLKAVADLGYTSPTPIQRRAVPLALAGHDLCGSAVTGSGKTAAYLLPILERLLYKPARIAATRVLILVPTRELATQVHSMAQQLARHCASIRCCLVVGGLALKPQEAELRTRPDIVVATPGRVLDHIRNSMAVHVDDVDVLVLDEADRLLEMGFEAEVTEIVRSCPPGRQTMLFSATMTAKVETLVKLSLRKPVRITADPLYDMASRLVQEFVRVRAGRDGDREAMLLALLTRSFPGPGVLVFASHKRDAHRLAILLGLAGLSASELHGNLTQRQRLEALEEFRESSVDYLIATDLAGRGLDISGVKVVINLEMPRDMATYVHRVGRTARAGRAGVSVTLVSEGQRSVMKEVVKRAALNVRARTIPPDVVAAFRAQIAAWEPDVQRVFMAERMEREMRLAEQDAAKASNLVHHEEEIKARPARTWFMSEGEKRDLRAKTVAASQQGEGDGKRAKAEEEDELAALGRKPKDVERNHAEGHRMSRKKRRRLEAAKADQSDARKVARLEAQVRERKRGAEGDGEAEGADDDDNNGGGRKGGAAGGGGKGGAAAGKGGAFPARDGDALDAELRKARKRVEATAAASEGGQYRLAKKAKSALRSNVQKLGMSSGQVLRFMKGNDKKGGKGKGKPKGGPAGGAGSGGAGGGGGGGGAFGAEKTQSSLGVKKGRHAFKSKSKHKRR